MQCFAEALLRWLLPSYSGKFFRSVHSKAIIPVLDNKSLLRIMPSAFLCASFLSGKIESPNSICVSSEFWILASEFHSQTARFIYKIYRRDAEKRETQREKGCVGLKLQCRLRSTMGKIQIKNQYRKNDFIFLTYICKLKRSVSK